MGEDLVLHDRRVVVHVDRLDGHRRDLGDEGPAERVGDRGVHPDEVEFDTGWGHTLGLESEALAEGGRRRHRVGCKRG